MYLKDEYYEENFYELIKQNDYKLEVTINGKTFRFEENIEDIENVEEVEALRARAYDMLNQWIESDVIYNETEDQQEEENDFNNDLEQE